MTIRAVDRIATDRARYITHLAHSIMWEFI